MKTIAALHSEHKQVSGEISFLKQEISFFLKLLSREYKNPASYEKVRLLDAYWKEFEFYGNRLEHLGMSVTHYEQNLVELCLDDSNEMARARIVTEKDVLAELKSISADLKTLKESFFSFMSETINR